MTSIYETEKMRVEIGEDYVKKQFKSFPGSKKRFKCEKEALSRLAGVEGFPQLISANSSIVVMSRLNGDNQKKLSDSALRDLRLLVEKMLESGVARHSLPERDLLIDNDTVSMVDFERVTLRHFRWSPSWLIAKKVTRFNLLRFISNHNILLLSDKETKELKRFTDLRAKLQKLKKIRSIRNLWRPKHQLKPGYTKKFKR
ncbi:hypothetical protein BCU68_02860 [Vibrio sp. 10N.286.49.B3]|uniref:hypothetical protein n=1 Tax=Vibrio sp. 10N.286.49.B3 TaxID=1880855 RepID=UPI000C867233|nr:hypothetical protein [Vibrio sp. 10N.286.49.B3]PMH44460.1 hypothetical protein BCU68_02860 [Vibrio sp. 10N.286.49.B3]